MADHGVLPPLEAGEDVVWQGRPGAGFHLSQSDVLMVFIAGCLLVSGLAWFYYVPRSEGLLWALGILLVGLPPVLVLKTIQNSKSKRASTWYSLTNQRAVVSQQVRNKGLVHDSYPITSTMPIKLSGGTPPSVWFGEKFEYRYKGRDVTQAVGFVRIADGAAVYQLMQVIKSHRDTP